MRRVWRAARPGAFSAWLSVQDALLSFNPRLALLLIVPVAVFFTQAGGRLAARTSIAWWLAGVLVGFSLFWPDLLRRAAEFIGFVSGTSVFLASLSVCLYMAVLELAADVTSSTRGWRKIVSAQAVREYTRLSTPWRRTGQKARVLVVLPCYNEVQSLPAVCPQLKELLAHSDFEYRICVVDDGSIDGTRAWLRANLPGEYVSHLANTNVSGVLLTGFALALELGVDYLVQCDADGQHPIEAIPKMLATAIAGDIDLLIGSRFVAGGGKEDHSTTMARRLGILVIRTVLLLFGSRVTDPTSGFRVYSRAAMRIMAKNMPDDYPEPEAVGLMAVAGARVAEFPVRMAPRETGISSISGIKPLVFMFKVVSSLIGLRIRSLAAPVRKISA